MPVWPRTQQGRWALRSWRLPQVWRRLGFRFAGAGASVLATGSALAAGGASGLAAGSGLTRWSFGFGEAVAVGAGGAAAGLAAAASGAGFAAAPGFGSGALWHRLWRFPSSVFPGAAGGRSAGGRLAGRTPARFGQSGGIGHALVGRGICLRGAGAGLEPCQSLKSPKATPAQPMIQTITINNREESLGHVWDVRPAGAALLRVLGWICIHSFARSF